MKPHLIVRAFALCIAFAIGPVAGAAPEQLSTISSTINDLRLVQDDGIVRSAKAGERISSTATLITGVDSRAEIELPDGSIVRLGSATTVQLKTNLRQLELREGLLLVEVPPKAKLVKIRGERTAVTLSRGTALFEYHPNVFKFLVLEEAGRIYRPNHLADSVVVNAGQMIFGKPGAAPTEPVDFEIESFVNTCRLISDFPKLPSASLISDAARQQVKQKSKHVLAETNLLIRGGGSAVVVEEPDKFNKQANSASPSSVGAATPDVRRDSP